MLSFSLVVGSGTPPLPYRQRFRGRVAPEVAHSLAGEGVGESQFRRGDIHVGTLDIYMYFVVVFFVPEFQTKPAESRLDLFCSV